ncbi:hypothetical protein ACS22W_25600, partial [Escherichia coli]|uniref:hypothetical protein n=1 Tax=Escherichia coli TaxID=562 RepID=UPI003F24B8A0
AIASFLRGRVAEHDNRLMRWSRARYTPLLDWAPRRRVVVLAGAAVLVVGCGVVVVDVTHLETGFVPWRGLVRPWPLAPARGRNWPDQELDRRVL